MTDWGKWRAKEQLFEEAGIMYSWEPVDNFTLFHYTLVYVPKNIRIPRTVYLFGTEINVLLDHWNRGGVWRIEYP